MAGLTSSSARPRRQPRRVGSRPVKKVRVAHITTIDMGLRYLLLNQLRYLQDAGYDITGISAAGPDVPVIQEAGIPHLEVPMNRKPFSPVADLKGFLHYWRLLAQEKFTIVHTHNPKPTFYGQIAARLAGAPIVVNTLHGFYFHENTHPVLRRIFIWMETVAARCADVILSQNQEDIQTAIREGICPPHKIKFLGNGIDLRRFHGRVSPAEKGLARQRIGLSPDHKVVGFVGRLVKEKGIPELLEAARILRAGNPNVRFLFIGPMDTDKPDALSPKTAAEYGVEDICTFLGLRHDLPELYSTMDVCALPSHREGFPRAPMEACAMGVPIVVTDIRGCREVIEIDRNGLLVPLKDSCALASALGKILSSPELAARYAAGARKVAEERFDERLVFDKVRGEYARLLGQKGLPVPGALTGGAVAST